MIDVDVSDHAKDRMIWRRKGYFKTKKEAAGYILELLRTATPFDFNGHKTYWGNGDWVIVVDMYECCVITIYKKDEK